MAGLLTEERALSIVNKRRVLSAESVVNAWNSVIKEKRMRHSFHLILSPKEIPLFYYEETIRSVLEKPMWRLIFDPGISLRRMRDIFGSDNRGQPCHQLGNRWWFFDKGCAWTRKKEEPSYYLVRMGPGFRNMTWTDQGLSMIMMGKKFVRASHRLMISFSISYYLIHGIYPFKDVSHWGPKIDSEELNICASRISVKGFTLYRWNRDCLTPDLGVCVIREYDCF